MSIHPYTDLEDFRFWSRAMAGTAPGLIDPAMQSLRAPRIEPHHRIASMGSCFAQTLTRHLQMRGLHYLMTEPPTDTAPAVTAPAGDRHGLGMYSARYGNVYTVRQALQLFDRAFGTFTPKEDVWKSGERYVDAFRPTARPGGFATAQEVRTEAQRHLACVREVFIQPDWLVMTLGLTEAWQSRRDGAVYPVAPGVAGGSFDPALHAFVNFTATEVSQDLDGLVQRIASVNPKARVLLTVSPVPMAATAEPRHICVSNSVTKSRLRVAADEAERRHEQVTYFPAYELVTSPAVGERYYDDDLRQVSAPGIKHVMRVFMRHFVDGADDQAAALDADLERAAVYSQVVCEEDLIEASLAAEQVNRAGHG